MSHRDSRPNAISSDGWNVIGMYDQTKFATVRIPVAEGNLLFIFHQQLME